MTNILFILLMLLYTLGIFATFKVVFQELNYWKWIPGRQKDTKYEKFCLYSFKIWKWAFDAYLIRYAPRAVLEAHVDPVKNGKHWRLNITLKGKSYFGIVSPNGCYGLSSKRFIFFRPDIIKHMVVNKTKTCLKLSLGFVKFK